MIVNDTVTINDTLTINDTITTLDTVTTEVFDTTTIQNNPSFPTNGLIAYYPFNGDANDESGNSNDGTVNGATLTTDRHGNSNSAYSFDGIDDYISVAHNSTLNFQDSNQFSLSYWIKAESLHASKLSLILSKQSGSGSSQNGWNSNIEINKTSNFRIKGTSGSACAFGDSNIQVGNNYHIVHIYDGNNGYIYINNTLAYESQCTASFGNSTSDMLIGKPTWTASNSGHFNGTIDDIAIYNRALTENEINALYSGSACTDTIEVTVYDTMIVNDTVTINDTITTLDTVTTEIFDTTTIQVYDTIQVMDTVVTEINDTNLITVADTLIITMSNDSSTTGINVITTEVKVYPNPASSQLNVVIDLAGDYTVSMSNINGQMVFTQANVVSNIQIDISEFNTGLYFIKIIDNNGNLKSEERKVVIE